MTYETMMEEINNIPMFGASGGLDNLKKYLSALNQPEMDFPVIHVAGTNGKGSVSAFMESVLRQAGYKTGLFTSPHLHRINERFRIDFEECQDSVMIRAWQEVRQLLDQREEMGLAMLTYFEIMFLMGMLIFSWEKVDYCILETGLGGRLDATVLCQPVMTVITSISLDHTALLGSTIPEIAAEKAGIIKEGIPIVYLEEENGASEIICKCAETKNAEVLSVSYGDVTFLKNERNTIDFSMENRYYKLNYVNVHSNARYQLANAALAMTALHKLLPDISDQVMRAGIANMRWPGRMEEIAKNIYVDGAHNPGAIQQICQMMQQKMPRSMQQKMQENVSQDTQESMPQDMQKSMQQSKKEDWSLLFAVCADKDYENMVRMLADIPWKHIYVTRIKTARGAAVEEVARIFRHCSQSPITIYETSGQALTDARSHLKEEDYLLCLGSLYLVGELKEAINRQKEREDYHD